MPSLYSLQYIPAINGESPTWADTNEMFSYIVPRLFVVAPDLEASISLGTEPPETPVSPEQSVHFHVDGSGAIDGIQVWANGMFQYFHKLMIGNIAWMPVAGTPEGWFPCDGNNGTPDLSASALYQPQTGIVLHQFRGYATSP